MHLVYQAREGMETPTVLRPSLVPPSKRKGTPPLPGAFPVVPTVGSTSGISLVSLWQIHTQQSIYKDEGLCFFFHL